MVICPNIGVSFFYIITIKVTKGSAQARIEKKIGDTPLTPYPLPDLPDSLEDHMAVRLRLLVS